MEAVRVWRDLGVVDTIYEEESEDSSTTPSLSPVISPSPTPLHSRVEEWSLAAGGQRDVLIHVQGSSFYLHKALLTARSGYMKRLLKESSEITLSPPLNITPQTFTIVTDFCYGAHIVITPFNVAPLRVAAELLEMTEANTVPDDNLRQKTEAYFRRVVAVNQEYASIVLRSCAPLLPEAETTACLVSRCIEALSLMDESDGAATCLDELIQFPPVDFQVVVESMNRRLTSQDLLYRIVDLYLKKYLGKITEEEKIRMCNYIDCSVLSSEMLMHAVQNPRMPLRFVVQAMFVEQLNTRRSIFSAAAADQRNRKHQREDSNSATLGAILQRDAELRQVEQLKAAMETTKSRIQSLEKELSGMRSLLRESENAAQESAGRSQSFRFSSSNKIERGQIGSVSSGSFRIINSRKDHNVRRMRGSSNGNDSSEESCDKSPRMEKNFGWRFVDGLKSALGVGASKKKSESDQSKFQGNGKRISSEKYEIGEGGVIVIKKNLPFHRQSQHV